MIINPKREILKKSRVLFTKEGCQYCRVYSFFIESMNMKLPIEKRVKVVNCDSFDNYGVPSNFLIPIFSPYFDGYPTLFIDGHKLSGSNTIYEVESWLYSYLTDEFITEEDNLYDFNKRCEFIPKKYFFSKRRVVCSP